MKIVGRASKENQDFEDTIVEVTFNKGSNEYHFNIGDIASVALDAEDIDRVTYALREDAEREEKAEQENAA